MTGETVFTVNGSSAKVAQPIGLAEAGLTERAHLQEWVLAHPQVLGTDVKIVTSEFGRWSDASGGIERDRLDLLGLDRDGRLVVVELKRDRAPDTVEMQALKYAALVSRFTRDRLASVHAQYLTHRRAETVEPEAALAELEAWATLSEDTLRLPRIVLMASGFPTTVTATVVFLHQQLALDVRLLAFQAYRTDHDVIVTISQHYPPPDVEEFVLSPEVNERRQARVAQQTRSREGNAVPRLIDAGVIDPGTRLVFQAVGDLKHEMADWLDDLAQPGRRFAIWLDDSSKPLQWEADRVAYSPTGLAQKMIEAATGRSMTLQGTKFWATPDGRTLVELAADLVGAEEVTLETHLAQLNPALRPTYDRLHEVLLGLGPDMTTRSKVKGPAYLAQRKIADLRFVNDYIRVLIRGLDPKDPDAAGLTASNSATYLAVQARTPGDVQKFEHLLRKAYVKQARP